MGRLRASSVVGVVVWAAAGFCLAWALMRTFGLERGFPLQAVVAWTPFVVPVAAVVAIAAASPAGGARSPALPSRPSCFWSPSCRASWPAGMTRRERAARSFGC